MPPTNIRPSRTVAIIQARMTSSRLPGKVLKDLAGVPVLHHVLTRCQAIPGINAVICAIPSGPEQAPLVMAAKACGTEIYQGSEQDVLDRYAKAARMADAEIILRVTSDCPIIDPGVCAAVLELRATQNLDYASNNLERSWPHGLDCEAFTRTSLEQADQFAKHPNEREHVTPWLRQAANIRRGNLPAPLPNLARHRWTLDFLEDYAFFQALFEYLAPLPSLPSWREVMSIVERHPELSLLNSRHSQLPAERATSIA